MSLLVFHKDIVKKGDSFERVCLLFYILKNQTRMNEVNLGTIISKKVEDNICQK